MENEAVWNETEMNEAVPNEDIGAEETAEKKRCCVLEKFAERYQSAQKACKGTWDRLAQDLKESGGNPYIRATSSFRYDIYRNADDEEPIDTFLFEKTNGCSLRALALATSLFVAANLAIKKHLKK